MQILFAIGPRDCVGPPHQTPHRTRCVWICWPYRPLPHTQYTYTYIIRTSVYNLLRCCGHGVISCQSKHRQVDAVRWYWGNAIDCFGFFEGAGAKSQHIFLRFTSLKFKYNYWKPVWCCIVAAKGWMVLFIKKNNYVAKAKAIVHGLIERLISVFIDD